MPSKCIAETSISLSFQKWSAVHIAGKAVNLAVSFPINKIIHFDNHAFFKIKQNCKNIIQTYNMLFNESHFFRSAVGKHELTKILIK